MSRPFREQSEYTFTCSRCDALIIVHDPEGSCPKCGEQFRIDWQAEYNPKKKDNDKSGTSTEI